MFSRYRARLVSDYARDWARDGLAFIGLILFVVVCVHLILLVGEHPFP
jgi:hypothetical protein